MQKVFVLAIAAAALVQTQEYEAAVLKPSAPGGRVVGCKGGPGSDDPSLLRCENISLTYFVSWAYRVEYYQVSAPDWMRDTRFDLQARIAPGTTMKQAGEMLKNLLADRFSLAVHHETRAFEQFRLVIAKSGPKLRPAVESKPDEPADFSKTDTEGYPILPQGRPSMSWNRDHARMYSPRTDLRYIANKLSGQLGKPVVDATGLNGEYELDLHWVSDAVDADTGPTPRQALESQLGLHLEPFRAPLDFVVVDHCDRFPIAN